MTSKETHWNNVASWYSEYLKGEDTYQEKVIAPNLLRLLDPQKGKTYLDVACGEGYFARLVASSGARVIGIDQAPELIEKAQTSADDSETYMLANAEKITELKLKPVDGAYCVLAFENIKHIAGVMEGLSALLKPGASFILVLLHPAFRIPQHSDWTYSKATNIQSRTIAKYASEIAIPIEVSPFKGDKKGNKKETTITFHRPLQWYMKIFKKAGFAIVGLEEWLSHKKSQPGIRQKAEDTARKEIPMFMALELRKF